MITTDWLGKMIGLPEQFLHCGKGRGGGVIQVTVTLSKNNCVCEIPGISREEILAFLPVLKVGF